MTITATRPHTVSRRAALLFDARLDLIQIMLDAWGIEYDVEESDRGRDVVLTLYRGDDTVLV
ncbi:hypothetical protein ACXWPT_09375, partial [Streptococcus pyogenes]